MKNSVVIVAGGKGLRMGSEIPKQFISVKGIPILMRTISAFYQFDNDVRIIVVLAPSYRKYWNDLCMFHKFTIPHIIVEGGDTRFHSVKNGLDLVETGIVAIHDGARPFVSKDLISKSFETALKRGSAIPVIAVTDSLRYINDDASSKIVDRSKYRLVQTPQVFDSELLKKAYQSDFIESFTDDASVVENLGKEVFLIEGEKENIKITTPFDLELADIFAK